MVSNRCKTYAKCDFWGRCSDTSSSIICCRQQMLQQHANVCALSTSIESALACWKDGGGSQRVSCFYTKVALRQHSFLWVRSGFYLFFSLVLFLPFGLTCQNYLVNHSLASYEAFQKPAPSFGTETLILEKMYMIKCQDLFFSSNWAGFWCWLSLFCIVPDMLSLFPTWSAFLFSKYMWARGGQLNVV